MNPNIFTKGHLTNEDQFTTSLAYILNLFPRELGDRLLKKLSQLSGKSTNYLGSFESAQFIGFEYQSKNSTSKPDMIINTSNTKLFFENKLDAPLSKLQLERHLQDVKRLRGKLIFVSNINTNISAQVR